MAILKRLAWTPVAVVGLAVWLVCVPAVIFAGLCWAGCSWLLTGEPQDSMAAIDFWFEVLDHVADRAPKES